jgi:hypothetical protein
LLDSDFETIFIISSKLYRNHWNPTKNYWTGANNASVLWKQCWLGCSGRISNCESILIKIVAICKKQSKKCGSAFFVYSMMFIQSCIQKTVICLYYLADFNNLYTILNQNFLTVLNFYLKLKSNKCSWIGVIFIVCNQNWLLFKQVLSDLTH